MSGETRVFTTKERRLVLLASCVAIFTTPLMGTMVNLALSTIGSDFGIGTHDQGWITTAYFLSSVVFMVPAARLSDIIGKRRMLITGLTVTMAGAALAALSPGYTMLLAARAVMGAGGAAISGTSISLLTEVYPRNERGAAIGLNTAMAYVGMSVGPVLGGLLVDSPLGWHSTFYMVIPFCLLALAAILLFRTDFAVARGQPFDVRGAAMYGMGIAAATLGMMNITRWYSPLLMVSGILMLYGFYRYQKGCAYPCMNVRVFRFKRYTRSVMAALLNYASSFAVSFFLALYLQDVGGWTAGQAGMILLVQPVIQAAITPLSGRLSDRIDGRYLPTAGMAFTTAGLAAVALLGAEVDLTQVMLALVMLGFGYALFSAPNSNVVMGSVGPRFYSEASGVLSTTRQFGMLLSMGIAMGCVSVFMGDAGISESVPSFLDAMRTSLAVFVAMCAVGCLLSWFRGGNDDVIEDA